MRRCSEKSVGEKFHVRMYVHQPRGTCICWLGGGRVHVHAGTVGVSGDVLAAEGLLRMRDVGNT